MKKLVSTLLLGLLFIAVYAAELPADGKCDWRDSQRIAPGIELKTFKYDKPRILSMYAVKVDLSNPRIRLIGTPPDKDHGKPMPDYPSMNIQTRRMRVWDYMLARRNENLDMRLAVNASPWRPWTKPYNHKYACNTGLTVYEGKVVALPESRNVPALVVYKNGKADMILCKVGDKFDSNIQTALSGFDFVLRNGKFEANKNKSLAPRTFYGLSKDRKTLYILVVDGRQEKISMGMNYSEGAGFMKYLGAHDAINMDGGGSTTLVAFSKGRMKLLNAPSDAKYAPEKLKYKSTRHVATSLGIYLTK